MCSVKGMQVCKRRYNQEFYKEFVRYERGFYCQSSELVKMLCAIKDMEVYSTYLQDVDWDALRKNNELVYKIINQFPIINKHTVKNNIEGFTNKNFNGEQMIMRTSGTTGGGLLFPYSIEMENRQWAIWWRYRKRLGIDFSTWCGWLGGKVVVPQKTKKAPYWRINKPGKQVMFSSYHLTDKTVKAYYDEIRKRKLIWLHGYPSHVARFAAYMLDAGLKPLSEIKYITTGAENLFGNQVELMSKAFPYAIIRQHYGLNEGVANISQNKDGEWEVDDEFCYVEFVPSKDNPTSCHIIGTSFSNKVFPLVRYDTGDMATIKDGKIISIDGRTSNVIKQPSGHDICEASLSIVLHDFGNITEAQFHQKSISKVELWVVKSKNYTEEDEKGLWINLNSTFEKDLHVTLKYVDAVKRTKAGKLKLVISEIL